MVSAAHAFEGQLSFCLLTSAPSRPSPTSSSPRTPRWQRRCGLAAVSSITAAACMQWCPAPAAHCSTAPPPLACNPGAGVPSPVLHLQPQARPAPGGAGGAYSQEARGGAADPGPAREGACRPWGLHGTAARSAARAVRPRRPATRLALAMQDRAAGKVGGAHFAQQEKLKMVRAWAGLAVCRCAPVGARRWRAGGTGIKPWRRDTNTLPPRVTRAAGPGRGGRRDAAGGAAAEDAEPPGGAGAASGAREEGGAARPGGAPFTRFASRWCNHPQMAASRASPALPAGCATLPRSSARSSTS